MPRNRPVLWSNYPPMTRGRRPARPQACAACGLVQNELRSIMSIAQRTVETKWEGSLASGSGTMSGTSGALDGQPVTWASRTEQPGGKTSPEELAAAAHSSCFSMALAATLAEHKLTPTTLTVSSTVTLDMVDGVPTVVSSAVKVDGDV